MKKIIAITFILLGSFAAVLWGSPPAASESTGSYSPSPIFGEVRATGNVTVDGQFVGNGAGITNGGGYVLVFSATASLSPANGTTYYFGESPGTVPTSTYDTFKAMVPRGGTIKELVWHIVCGGAGSAEAVVWSVVINTNTTAGSTSFTLNQLATNVISDVSIAVAKSDIIVAKMVAPTWGTPPTTLKLYLKAYIE